MYEVTSSLWYPVGLRHQCEGTVEVVRVLRTAEFEPAWCIRTPSPSSQAEDGDLLSCQRDPGQCFAPAYSPCLRPMGLQLTPPPPTWTPTFQFAVSGSEDYDVPYSVPEFTCPIHEGFIPIVGRFDPWWLPQTASFPTSEISYRSHFRTRGQTMKLVSILLDVWRLRVQREVDNELK